MGLADELRNDLKTAMRAKDQARLGTIRVLMSALQEEAGAKRQRALDRLTQARGVELREIPVEDLPPDEPLTEPEMRDVLGREIKKRQDAHEAYSKAGRPELAAAEAAAIATLQSYLPPQLGPDEARARVAAIIVEMQGAGPALTQSDMKRVMPVVMERLRGQADGRALNQLVRELLSS